MIQHGMLIYVNPSYLSPKEFIFTNSNFEEDCKESKLIENKIIKSIELDVIIAIISPS